MDEEFSTGSDQSDVEWDRVTREQFENSDIFYSEEELPTPDIGPATDFPWCALVSDSSPPPPSYTTGRWCALISDSSPPPPSYTTGRWCALISDSSPPPPSYTTGRWCALISDSSPGS
ncbi:hypothetical protein J6590_089244 [Homalodisca vitripennis]|nr:hypothetical protein J6590_089244 [Homalodisca vitripennis]